jgi:glucokinase
LKKVISFDIGGTFIKYGVVNSEGEILMKTKFPSPDKDCGTAIPEHLINVINNLSKEYEISGVAISTAGQVDSKKGEVVFASDNLPDYSGAKIVKIISESTKLKCILENDVNAAAIGEMWKGAAIGKDTFFCMTLGTGIGGAIIINGKLYNGAGGFAGEIGHTIINEQGEKCNCGGHGCYERYASTSSLLRNYIKESGIKGEVSGIEIIKKVNENDPIAIKIYNEFLDHIVTGLVNITHLLDPGLIVIGGGISEQGEPFFNELNKKFKDTVLKSYASYTKIVKAKLGNDAGLLGAAYLYFNN